MARSRREIAAGRFKAECLALLDRVAVLLERGRVRSDRDPLEWIEGALAELNLELLPLTPAVALRATQLGTGFHRDPADRQIVATALVHGAKLITKDEHIQRAGLVETIW